MNRFPKDFSFGIKQLDLTKELQEIRKFIYGEFIIQRSKNQDYVLFALEKCTDDAVKQILKEILKRFKYVGFPLEKRFQLYIIHQWTGVSLMKKISETTVLKNIAKYERLDIGLPLEF